MDIEKNKKLEKALHNYLNVPPSIYRSQDQAIYYNEMVKLIKNGADPNIIIHEGMRNHIIALSKK
jgi:hypothetical protein